MTDREREAVERLRADADGLGSGDALDLQSDLRAVLAALEALRADVEAAERARDALAEDYAATLNEHIALTKKVAAMEPGAVLASLRSSEVRALLVEAARQGADHADGIVPGLLTAQIEEIADRLLARPQRSEDGQGGTVATLAERVAERLRDESLSIHTGHDGRVKWTLEQARSTAEWLHRTAALVEAADKSCASYGCHICGDPEAIDKHDRALRSLAEALGVAPEQEHRSPQGEERPGERQETEP